MNPANNDKRDMIFKDNLETLRLKFIRDNAVSLASKAANEKQSHMEFLKTLIEGEILDRQKRMIDRLVKQAKFPTIKDIAAFDWAWPNKIDKEKIKHIFELHFLKETTNIILLGPAGLGKTHLSIALGRHACMNGHSVLFTSAMDIINSLSAARTTGRLKFELKKYIKPEILIMDELGYLPIDQLGSNLLFQVISQRYEKGSIVLTTNKVFKQWPDIFNKDSTITSAVLDRLLHHAETLIIQGKSYRMKDRNQE